MPSRTTTKLIPVPAHVMEIPNGIFIKRGATEVVIRGAVASTTIKRILRIAQNGGATEDQIVQTFDYSDRKHVRRIITNLLKRHILVPSSSHKQSPAFKESALDVFCSNFGSFQEDIRPDRIDVRFSIVGVNSISKELALSLKAAQHSQFVVFDHPDLRNKRMFTADGILKSDEWPLSLEQPSPLITTKSNAFGDCLIATSDFGGRHELAYWNKVCLQSKITFFPIFLKNMIGYVGPFVFPGDTPCFECLLVRIASHSADPYLENLLDRVANSTQHVDGFHPAMANVLGGIAAFELFRFYSVVIPKRDVGQYLEVDLLGARMTDRPLLKVPRCAACSAFHKSSETNILKVLFPETTGPR